jgi:phosphatidylserine/phosphatidylglycerophosphate/cardiolipin synthase-like enzyme
VIEALLELPSHLRDRLAGALDSGLLAPPRSPASVRAVLGIREDTGAIVQALGDLEGMGIVGRGAAVWIRMLDRMAAQRPSPDLVWSGPEVHGLNARKSGQVYQELLGSAERTIWASTFAFFDGPKAFEVMARRMDEMPALRVALLLNIQRRRGDATAADQLVRRFADRFWKLDWPGIARPDVFYDPRSLEVDGPTGVLHAKAVVADEESVFITSANLTEAALERNIELGLLLRDRALAASVVSHFRGLIEGGLLRPLPAS